MISQKVYDYELPEEKIAKYPLERRDASKLLVYKSGVIADERFGNIASLLPQNSLLVRNDTKVIRARLKFAKKTGAVIEIFCLEPLAPAEVELAFVATGSCRWKCIVGNSKRWKEGALEMTAQTQRGAVTLSATRLEADGNTSTIEFNWSAAAEGDGSKPFTFAEVIEAAGIIPIPPYLNRDSEPVDDSRYQTVYSQHKGSVAAPTAGLHFTPEVLADVAAKGHETLNVTLHVGAGTFKPVQTDDVTQHVMHTEHIVVTADAIERLARQERKVVAVGTTSVRTIESLYWLGVKLIAKKDIEEGLAQWDAYNLPQEITLPEALGALLGYLKSNDMSELHSQTQIMIMPGYKFRVVDALITNFHQPHSTLLLLIGAFVGMDWERIYDHALNNDYRFLSYGDSSLLMP